MIVKYNKQGKNGVNSIDIVYELGGKIRKKTMNENDQCWYIEIPSDEKKLIYKFVINNGIRINDSDADGYCKWIADEVWSYKICDGEKKRYKHPDLITYSMGPGIRYGQYNSNKKFTLGTDKKFSISIDLDNVIGIHSVTVVWYENGKNITHIEEKTIDGYENAFYKINAVFWINLPEQLTYDPLMSVEIYVDGNKIITDYFQGSQIREVRNIYGRNQSRFNNHAV